MIIADRLRTLREQNNLSQEDIEKRTGLFRSYISRVENGHSVPAVETLEKFARALEVPMYQLFYDGDEPLKLLNFPSDDNLWGSSGKDSRLLLKFCKLFSQIKKSDLKLLMKTAEKMANLKSK